MSSSASRLLPETAIHDRQEMTSMPSMHDVKTIATGLDHSEGVALGPDGMLYAGGEAGQVYRVDHETATVEVVASVEGGFMLGLCLDASGAIFVCDAGAATVHRLAPSGDIETWCATAAGGPISCPNWPVFGPDGSLYVSDSGPEDPGAVEGRVLRVPPGGGDADVLDLPPLHFPNGMAMTSDGVLVLLESFSPTPRLVAVRENGLEVLAEFPDTVPDGVACTADGGFIVSCYYPYHVYRVHPDRRVELILHDTLGAAFPMPTNVCFFGGALTSLAIASLGGQTLSAIDLGVPGAPLFYPEA
jgi:gluconolactonase